MQRLQSAVFTKRAVCFSYTNNNNETRIHMVEPVALLYRWYAWYLLAWSRVKKDYRTYKLVRMRDLRITDQPLTMKHESPEKILQKLDETDTQSCTHIVVCCKAAMKVRAIEYLKGEITEEYENGDVRIELDAADNELFWFGALLALGDSAEVISPESIRRKVLETAEKIVSLYFKI